MFEKRRERETKTSRKGKRTGKKKVRVHVHAHARMPDQVCDAVSSGKKKDAKERYREKTEKVVGRTGSRGVGTGSE